MSWKPKNWDKLKWDAVPYNSPPISGEEVGNVFEAGAAAAHKADVEWIGNHSVRFTLEGAVGIFMPLREEDWQAFIEYEK